MNNSESNLTQISDVFFDENSSFGDSLNATRAYKNLLYSTTDFNIDLPEANTDLFTDSGKAIASKWAGMCIDDFMRTKKFCLGLYKAVLAKKAESKGKVHILYAGTGPFAALVLPLTTRFGPDEVSFSLLELNEYSFQTLKKVIDNFNLKEYVDTLEQCDATQFVVANPNEIDILLTETMTHALKSEHQVAISHRLYSQLPENTVLIPQEIKLNLLAVNDDIRDANQKSLNEPRPYFDRLGTLFLLNSKEIRKNQEQFNISFPNFIFSENIVSIPQTVNMQFHHLSVETFIKIYEDVVLEANESGLTTLLKLTDLNSMLNTVSAVKCAYVCGNRPGLQCQLKN